MDAAAIAYRAVELGAMQKQDELEQLLELLIARRPQRILEVGCFMGGTLYAWRQLCAEVWAIDRRMHERFNHHGAQVLFGDSHDPRLMWLAWDRVQNVDVLFIDGDHTYEGVKQDLESYRGLVRRGGLIVFHDIVVSADPNCEVWRLWAELPREHRREIVRPPKTWGGIGLLEVG